MPNFNGTVRSCSARSWQKPNSDDLPIDLWSFQLEGNRQYFRTGTNDPGLRSGDSISFEADDSGNVLPRKNPSIKKGAAASATTAGASATGGPSGSAQGGSREDYWTKKGAEDKARDKRYQTQDVPRMSFSAAQDRAVHLVAAAVSAGALSLPTKKGEQYDSLLGYVDRTADKFLMDAMDAPARLEQLQQDAAVASESVDAAVAEDGHSFDE